MIYFTVLKTKVALSPLFFAVLTAFLLVDKSGIAGEAVLFSLLHETGHFLALLCAKTHPQTVEASLFGIRMSLPGNLSTAKKCFVLTAGFAVNFIFMAAFFSLGKITEAYINLFIGIFTAMPLAATDGGAVLKTLLDEFFPQGSKKIFDMLSLGFSMLVSVFLICIFLFSENIFILIAIFYMAVCAVNQFAK
ncbi:MAG: hypothetical protein IJ306_08390 [Oscillospiraceae bacterium]|nr:hypothetical protein [Oscillospiraceae bacterium]